MATDYHVIIVGAGPAGSTCAWFAAKAGLRVLLVDAARFPRDKACGDAFTRTKAVPILEELGLVDELQALPSARCETVRLTASNGAHIDLPPPRGVPPSQQAAYVCPRKILDERLLARVRPLVDVVEGCTVTGVLRDARRITGITGVDRATGRRQVWRGAVVVGADGTRSIVAQHTGLLPRRDSQLGLAVRGYFEQVEGVTDQLELYCFDRLRPGYLWMFPCGGGRANVGLYLLKSRQPHTDGALIPQFWDLVRRHPTLAVRFRSASLVGPLTGWPLPLWSRRRRLSTEGALLIGDAANLIDPATGEGIGNAMLSGKLAAGVIAEALAAGDTSAAVLRQYDARLWTAIGRELRLARLLQGLMRQPGGTEIAITLAHRHAAFRRMATAALSAPGGKRDFLSLDGWKQAFARRDR